MQIIRPRRRSDMPPRPSPRLCRLDVRRVKTVRARGDRRGKRRWRGRRDAGDV